MGKNLILITFVLSLALPLSVLAIAQTVKPILIDNALRGEEYEESLSLFNTEDKEIKINLTATGDIEKWATFFEPEDLKISIENIIVPSNSQKRAIVKFLIPEDIPNGTYSGKIVASTFSEKIGEEGASASVALEVPREVSIEVTDKEIIDCRTDILPKKLSLKKNEPLKINVIYFNKGNVRIKPSVQQKIIKNGEIIFNVIHPYPEGKEGIKPNHSETLTIEWQSVGQESGEYKAEIKVLLNDEVMGENDFRFIIVSDMEKFLASIAVIGGGNLTLAWFVIGGILMIIAGILIVIRKRKIFLKNKILKNVAD